MQRVIRTRTSENLIHPLDLPLPDFDDNSGPSSARGSDPRCNRKQSPRQQLIPVIPSQGKVPHISVDTMNRIMNGSYTLHFEGLKVIDCRFKYEYEGGHIHGSINVNDAEELDRMFFQEITRRTLVIFHCEFSQVRGPELADFFRKSDRQMNEMVYPNLHYPHVYVLHGGYSAFHEAYPQHCDGSYTKMFISSARENGQLALAQAQYKQNLDRARTTLNEKKHESNENVEQDQCSYFDPMSPKKQRRRRVTSA
jgi:M-phase inducer tyrosine phosphatase